MRRALAIGLLLVYPLAVWAGARAGATGLVAAAAVALLLGRGLAFLRRAEPAARRRLLVLLATVAVPGTALLVASGGAAASDPRLPMALPVVVSGVLLATFAHSLVRPGPSMAEAFARLRVTDLSPEEVRYCRAVTAAWCIFFAANALVAGALAATGALDAWALWTGLLAYVAMGVLFAVELTVRTWRFRRYHGSVTDPLFRRIFPPRTEGPERGATRPDGAGRGLPPGLPTESD